MQLTVTGHRPHHLEGGYSGTTRTRLEALAHRTLRAMRPDHVFIGMAQGWDQACAVACNRLALPWAAVLPGFAAGHTQDMTWPRPAQERYLSLLETAADVMWLPWPGAGREYAHRDMKLVELGDWVLALWDGAQRSGTGLTVRLANERQLPIWNVWEEWTNG